MGVTQEATAQPRADEPRSQPRRLRQVRGLPEELTTMMAGGDELTHLAEELERPARA
ncbi:hypothetical protein [Modestobacter marinus]|uniref:hypothetical protein n=1 Tax=Modestobacter marinus TaxID=477641 RepID=UPI001C9770F0|nr:hypothetical protein [Modestobacter marinus]